MTKYTRIGQKYQIGDRVKKKYFGGYKYGAVIDCDQKSNRLNRAYYYYQVLWDTSKMPETQSQSTIQLAEEA